MKKTSRFLILFALVAAAATSTPKMAVSSCLKPACLIGPGCCINADCDAYCTGRYGPGTIAHCDGGGTGGCCSCEIVE